MEERNCVAKKKTKVDEKSFEFVFSKKLFVKGKVYWYWPWMPHHIFEIHKSFICTSLNNLYTKQEESNGMTL